uniref:Uncharacterized protein n=1 Tax=Knipowitschia caucasica TaxID=637954 RepID=A0AAV2LBG2_KNICA
MLSQQSYVSSNHSLPSRFSAFHFITTAHRNNPTPHISMICRKAISAPPTLQSLTTVPNLSNPSNSALLSETSQQLPQLSPSPPSFSPPHQVPSDFTQQNPSPSLTAPLLTIPLKVDLMSSQSLLLHLCQGRRSSIMPPPTVGAPRLISLTLTLPDCVTPSSPEITPLRQTQRCQRASQTTPIGPQEYSPYSHSRNPSNLTIKRKLLTVLTTLNPGHALSQVAYLSRSHTLLRQVLIPTIPSKNAPLQKFSSSYPSLQFRKPPPLRLPISKTTVPLSHLISGKLHSPLAYSTSYFNHSSIWLSDPSPRNRHTNASFQSHSSPPPYAPTQTLS